MATTVHRMRPGARRLHIALGVFCCVFVIPLPIGIFMLLKAFRTRVELDDEELRAQGALSRAVLRRGHVERVGLLRIPVRKAIGQVAAGGAEGVNLVWIDVGGKKGRALLSQVEGTDEILARVPAIAGKPLETCTLGAFGPKWPETAAS
ncbi:MAG: hypothetical protein IT460_09965 [Planctomycetes bacterium]|nr:hypothetical protein [Planctomycetota bacterium]